MRYACSLLSRIKICVCGKCTEICGFVCADLRRDTCSKIYIVMDHEMCLTWYSVGAQGLGDANLHRNREALLLFKKVAKISNFDHKSPFKYYRPVPDTTWNLDTGTRELRPPEPPASTMPMSTVVAPERYTGQGSVEVASLPLDCHNLGTSTTCEMTPPGHSQSESFLWHSTHVHHDCNWWHDLWPGPWLSLHTITHSSPGQEQSVGGTTPRWHAKLLVSYSCCLRGTEHDTGAQGPRSIVPATCDQSPTLWHVANKLAEPNRME